MPKKKKQIDKILAKVDYEDAWETIRLDDGIRLEDDSPHGFVKVAFSVDGDAWIEIVPDENRLFSVCRFRSFSGGGKSLRVRQALILLALAIQADNDEFPQRKRWWF